MSYPDEQTLPPAGGDLLSPLSRCQQNGGEQTSAVIDRSMSPESEEGRSTKSAADIIFAHSPAILQRAVAQQAKQAAQRAKLDTAIAESVASQQFSLPFWAPRFRALPNEVFRSALFNARNRQRKRVYLRDHEIYVIGSGRITYTGEELRQDDETVWLQLIQLAKSQLLGEAVRFTARSFLLAIGWPIKSQSYVRLRDCLTRMQATSLQVIVKRLDGSNEKGEEDGRAISMIPVFEWRDPRTGAALKRYSVQLAPQLVDLYGGEGYFTRVEWAQRIDLPPGLATWLHGYFASHAVPFPIKLTTIKAGAGLTTTAQKHLRELVKTALGELKRVGFLKDGSVGPDGLVRVERMERMYGLWPTGCDR